MIDSILETVIENKGKFIFLWALVFILTFSLSVALDIAPQNEEVAMVGPILAEATEENLRETLEDKLAEVIPSLPQRVVIDDIGVEVQINNPESRRIEDLDNSLLTGAVRYPDSGLLGEKTNILLFGHSSNLPIVRNDNFRAFNKLEDLQKGKKVSVFSETHEFIYEITSVEEADAENALVVFESDKREITLSTCNTFGDLNDRFVVKAELVDIKKV